VEGFCTPLRLLLAISSLDPGHGALHGLPMGLHDAFARDPQLFPERYGFNSQQVGLQYLSFVLGAVIGEQVGGRMSDFWMNQCLKRTGRPVDPEYRLWLNHAGHALAVIGTVVFLVQIDASEDSWDITPLVGATLSSMGNQLVTTVFITYAVDCYREDAASVGVFVTFIRQTWGFIGPFWWVLSCLGHCKVDMTLEMCSMACVWRVH
jgi:hypothetical protein